MISSIGRHVIYGLGGVVTRLAVRDWGRATGPVQRLYLMAHLLGKHLLDGRALKALAALARPGMVVCDVGANVGVTTVIFAEQVGPGGRVLAFEPDPFNAAVLRRHVDHHRLQNRLQNVLLFEMGIGDGPGNRHLRINRTNRADSRVLPAGAIVTSDAMTIPCESLDAMLARLHVDQVDLVKIDVQGFEPFVLRGMRNTLAKNPGLQVVLEFFPDGLAEQGQDPRSLLAFLFETFAVVERWAGRRWIPLSRREISAWLGTFEAGAYTDLWCHP